MATCHGILHDLAPICGKLHRENDEQTIGLWGLVPRKGWPFGPTKNGASLDIFRIEPATLGGHEFRAVAILQCEKYVWSGGSRFLCLKQAMQTKHQSVREFHDFSPDIRTACSQTVGLRYNIATLQETRVFWINGVQRRMITSTLSRT
jgi:hypothetical protein